MRPVAFLLLSSLFGSLSTAQDLRSWQVDSADEWQAASKSVEGVRLEGGLARATAPRSRFISTVQLFDTRRKAKSITIRQSPQWNNWTEVPNVGPEGAKDAPIFLPIEDDNYWFFAEHPDLGQGYHAWHSSDMQQWEYRGVASNYRWVTTAEYAHGKIYLYFDKPNDQDPHLIIGENLTDSLTWTEVGKVFDDPSHGSDAGVIRTADGVFHLIYEDWTPVDAPRHSWDSPLAGHVDSPDGINGFMYGEHPPVIDHRTTPTGETGTYSHSFTSSEPLEYEIHEPGQNAYGDFTLIQVGATYYLFCDYHPYEEQIRIGYFTSESINGPFEFTGSFGTGHPDPTIGFAEGRFYLIIQRSEVDYVSSGPWVDVVEARAGVDVDGDGVIDQWTNWQRMTESYRQKHGFARVIEADPAQIDLAELDAGLGFAFQFRTESANGALPVIDRISVTFDEE